MPYEIGDTMLINFNIEKLDELLYDFHRITGLTISVWNAQFRQLSYQPKEMCGFCRMIKSSPVGNHRCFLSDKALCIECGKTGKPATHYCHAGLIDTAIPILFKNTILGYIMFGQIANKNVTEYEGFLAGLSKELRLDYALLRESYNDLQIYDEDIIRAAANILKIATRALWLSQYIEIGYNTAASKIDDFIRSNIDKNISVAMLCENLKLSKSRLYEISHQFFQMPIGEYIAYVRIEDAKRLLCTTDLPVSQISVMLGIKNYNYFTKFFKANVGMPPLKYRKNFPFSLSEENTFKG